MQAATAVAKLRCRSQRHTVASAARTVDGRVFTGVNVRHASAAVCAELVVIATAATQGVTALETIVTVADRGREVVAPCARCRQVLADHFPDLRVIVGPMDVPLVVPLGELPAETGSDSAG
ncbi:cytidine deaminase [Micromonospora sp. M51]|uniref:cytidine deaminase family protein n=1 Tax=Micromonospora sp. M51 TaxID=2824889 RepID=UPI0028114378|nr:cytidine deaminase [Micromonospora sp. M51]